jgi:hypothetical protein
MKHKRATFRRRRNLDSNVTYRAARSIREERERPQRKLLGADKARFMAAARYRELKDEQRSLIWNGARGE